MNTITTEEHDVTQQTDGRRIVTNMALSLDGHYAAPHDPLDMSWVMPYAVTDVARDHLTGLWDTATTALLGRVNAEGFLGFWPTVIGMEGVDPRDEGFAKWIVDTDKVVLSSTLDKAPWERTTIVNKPSAQVAADLKSTDGGDILVLSSARASSKHCSRPTRSTGWPSPSFPSFSAAGRASSTTVCPRASGHSSAGHRANTARWRSSTTASAEPDPSPVSPSRDQGADGVRTSLGGPAPARARVGRRWTVSAVSPWSPPGRRRRQYEGESCRFDLQPVLRQDAEAHRGAAQALDGVVGAQVDHRVRISSCRCRCRAASSSRRDRRRRPRGS
jgi:hypothetical protein